MCICIRWPRWRVSDFPKACNNEASIRSQGCLLF